MAQTETPSTYLPSRTDTLTSTQPVAPSQAQAAQIPLQSFVLPTFPPEAFTSNLQSLVLTSDIPLNIYPSLITSSAGARAWSVSELPESITSLTLELFAFGYPPGFLTGLGKKLGNVEVLTVYSQLFAGTTSESRVDAVNFLKGLSQKEGGKLKEVHFIDTFVGGGFWEDVGEVLGDVKVVEVSYAWRRDPEFLQRTGWEVMPKLVREGLRGLVLGMEGTEGAEADAESDEVGERERGMCPVGSAGEDKGVGLEIVERLCKVPQITDSEEDGDGKEGNDSLIFLDLTLFALPLSAITQLLEHNKALRVLAVSVSLDDEEKLWSEIVSGIAEAAEGNKESALEMIELVGVPGDKVVEKMKEAGEVNLGKEDVEALGKGWGKLKAVKGSILRSGVVGWGKEGDEWKKVE